MTIIGGDSTFTGGGLKFYWGETLVGGDNLLVGGDWPKFRLVGGGVPPHPPPLGETLLKILCKKVNYDLKGITDWLNANRISLNVNKTEFIIFRSPRSSVDCDYEINIRLNGKRLYPSTYIKYLGILLDEHLSWKPHINELTKKLRRSNSMLSKIRHYVDKNTIRSLYFSTFSPHINYCCQIWGQKGNYHLNRILSLQRSALRIINFKPFHSDVCYLYRSSNVPIFTKLVQISNLMFVFDSLKNNLPISISKYFCQSRDIHSHYTRNINGKLVPPAFKSQKIRQIFN